MANKKTKHLSDGTWNVISSVTELYETFQKEAETTADPKIKNCFKEVGAAQLRLFKVWFSLKPEYRVPMEKGESFDHFIAKNEMVKSLNMLFQSLHLSISLRASVIAVQMFLSAPTMKA